MIYIVTAVPRTGKTLFALDKLCEGEFSERKKYYHHIDGLMLPYAPIGNIEKWQDMEHGSVLVVDEAHKYFYKTDGRKAPPKFIQDLDEHGHYGFDIILITQCPTDLNTFVRNRVSRHYHLSRPISNAEKCTVFVWSEYNENYKKGTEQARAESFEYLYNKKFYNLYKSASIHTVKRYVPKKLKRYVAYLVLSLVLMGVALSQVSFFKGKNEDTIVTNNEVKNIDNNKIASEITESVVKRLDNYLAQHTPIISGLPDSAPIYSDVKKPVSYPRLNCISSATRCSCYTQQASLVIIPEQQCRDIVENGYFDYGVGG